MNKRLKKILEIVIIFIVILIFLVFWISRVQYFNNNIEKCGSNYCDK